MIPKYKSPARIPLKKRDWIEGELTSAPIWCSVDLRDGNQALPMPMNPARKLEYFKLLTEIGSDETPAFLMPTYTAMFDLRGEISKHTDVKAFYE